VEIDIAKEPLPHGVTVRVQVRLSGREAGSLFLNGDSLIHLPLEGALPDVETTPIPRMSIYLSELAASRDGIARAFTDDEAAERYAATVRRQLENALEASS
jgi:hypothetical protein